MSTNPFLLAGRVAVVTGGYGVLGGHLAAGLSGTPAMSCSEPGAASIS